MIEFQYFGKWVYNILALPTVQLVSLMGMLYQLLVAWVRGVVIVTKTLATLQFPIQGGPERTQHLRSIISKNEGQNEQVVCIIAYKLFFQQDDTKIVNFDEGVLILWPFFWGNVIFKICPFISRVTIYVPNIFVVWLPLVKFLLLLCKAKPAWIKRSIHYATLQHYNPGELLKEIPPYLKRDFWLDTKGANFKNDIASEKWL